MSSDSPFLTFAATATKFRSAGFTEPSLRWLRFNGDENGFNDCVVSVGRKLLIDEPKFVAWVRSKSVGIRRFTKPKASP